MDNPFEMTQDVNGKPVPRWQVRLEQMYTVYVPFGEILGYVRYILEEHDIDQILNAPDNVILANSPNVEQFASEMRQKFDTLGRIVRERDMLGQQLNEAIDERGRFALEVARLRGVLQSITLYPISYDVPLTNSDLWGIINDMQGIAAGAITDKDAAERVHTLFLKKLAEHDPSHPWIKTQSDT